MQHFGPDAEDVEHMSERYIDEQLPGAVQVPRCEDPRPRFAEFALLEQPSSDYLGQDSPPSQVQIVVQGHEEFDDEITLAGSGRVTPYGEAPHQHSQGISPEGTATSPKSTQEGNTEANQEKSPQESQLQMTGNSSPEEQDDGTDQQAASHTLHAETQSSDSERQDAGEMQQEREQPLPSLTPYRKPANRTAAVRSSWSHPASVS